eukprot:TRINITY_DN8253_c0_g1_i1.p1 TRINITY_DN8253_c0_g1~~TRINITY_DN8253_c0_g1_i1.p1  ORF type:complete len:326 (-),score=55.37 TRINITY_DN8253_c0_g1_i1:115-1068(-)
MYEFNHYQANINGINMHFVKEGEGHPVVLVHGWPDLWFGWRKQIRPLQLSGYQVIVPDLRGFGQTTPYSTDVNDYGWKTITADLDALLNYLNISQAVFIGHDWGGMVVWRMGLYYPNRVTAIGSLLTPFYPRRPIYMSLEDMVKINRVLAYQYYFNSDEAANNLYNNIDTFFKLIYRRWDHTNNNTLRVRDNHIDIASLDNVERDDLISESELNYYITQYKHSGFESNLNYYRTTRINWEDEENLPKTIQHPALMVTAGKDKVLPPSMTTLMKKGLVPDCEYYHIEHAAHWVQVEQPVMVNKILISWLNSILLNSKL